MAPRFTYSRWDGTQVGFELDAERIFEEITDDLLYHGDLNNALRRMMQSGFTDRNGERLQGMREMLEKLRRKRKDSLDQYDLGGVYDDIAQELRDIVEQERRALDDLMRAARESGDQRRQDVTQESNEERNFQLDMLPPDLAGQVRELQQYDFAPTEAASSSSSSWTSCASNSCKYFNQMRGRDAERVARADAADEGHARCPNDSLQQHQRARTRRNRSTSSCSVTAISSRRTRRTSRSSRGDGPAYAAMQSMLNSDDARAAFQLQGRPRSSCSTISTCVAGRPARREPPVVPADGLGSEL
jgi:hypothetical protein